MRSREVGLRVLAAALFFGLAGTVIFKLLPPERAWPAVALALIGTLIALVPWDTWRALLASIDQATIGPVSVALRQNVEQATANAPPADTGEGLDVMPSGKATSMLDLRLRLEWKLAYVAKNLLAGPDGSPTFFTIGSLKFDGYLTDSEARTAIGILSTTDERLWSMAHAERGAVLREAEAFVDSVRASIFWGFVKRTLRGEDVPDVDDLWRGDIDGGGKRDDMLAGRSDSEFWVAPAFALDADSAIRRNAIKRLKTKKRPYGVPCNRRIVVVPDKAHGRPEEHGCDDGPHVVKLSGLRRLVEHPPTG